MRAEIVIAKYTLIDYVLIEVVAVIVVPGVLAIGKKIGAAVEWVPLRLRILL